MKLVIFSSLLITVLQLSDGLLPYSHRTILLSLNIVANEMALDKKCMESEFYKAESEPNILTPKHGLSCCL